MIRRTRSVDTHRRKCRRIRHISAAFVTAAILVGVASAGAASGDLDPAFGNGGLVTTGLAGLDAVIQAVVIQSDGKIVAAGYARDDSTFPPPTNFLLARYTSGGSLDAMFGNGGIVTANLGGVSVANAVAIQSDGKIVAAGWCTFSSTCPGVFALARFNSDGTLDTTFGSGGKVITDIGQANNGINAIAIQPDGRIVVGGGNGDAGDAAKNFVVTRYHTNGSLDSTFGSGGIAFTNFGRGGIARGLAIQSDGKIVEAGPAGLPSYPFEAFALVRFNSDGSLDSGFGSGGKVTTSFEGGAGASDVIVQSDGKLVAVGGARNSAGNGGFGLARYNTDGSLDASFGEAGTVLTLAVRGISHAVGLQADGKILAAGDVVTPSGSGDFALARYASDGRVDASFSNDGIVTTDFGGSEAAFTVAIQPDGNIVAAGATVPSMGKAAIALARYLGTETDGTPPLLTVPSPITTDATNPSGAVVLYSASATDDVDGTVPVTCAPPSGSTFPIGTTTVTCTATDASGNESNASFAVHVKGAPEQVADLIALVDSYNLRQLGAALHDKLVKVQVFLAANKPKRACERLDAFLAQVKEQRGKRLPIEQADTLTADARRTKTVIAC